MTLSHILRLLLALTPLPQVLATQYQISKTYAGQTFFDDWVYYNNFDNLTNGDAIFVSKQVGTSSGLTTVNAAGNAVIKVDNTTQVPFNIKRNTVRISTPETYGIGSLWVADFLHVPFGCSVWPAWWSQAEKWPEGGEIDVFEGVNLQTNNQMSLHTTEGCKLVPNANTPMTGNVTSTDCSSTANNNQGCIVTDARPQSFGAAFGQAGGGVFVTELAESGVSIWFYPRANVPSSLTGNGQTLDTATLGTPVATYSTSGCPVQQFFEPQHLILDITLCGDFAGNPAIFNQTCQGVCYNDFVIGPPSNYDNAYFEVKSIKTFLDPSVAKPTGSSQSQGGGSGSGSGGGSNGSSNNNNNNSGAVASAVGLGTVSGVVALMLAGVASWMM